MQSPLRLRQLEALKAASDHGSMTHAAKHLGISQPAVSRLLSDLSAELGFKLFDRRDGRLVPTQEARFLLPDISRVLEMMTHISETSRNLIDRKAGHIRIACLPGFATSHLPKVIAEFLKDRPGVTATIEPDRPERILEWIIGEQYDCGITDGFNGHPAIESKVVPIRSVCIFPAGHRLSRLQTISAGDLADEKLIHTRRDSPFFSELSEAFANADLVMDLIIETRQFTVACELVSLGLGVSIVSELDARSYIGAGVDYRPFVPTLPHQLSLVRPIHKKPSMITLEFLETFEQSLGEFRL